jgi:bacillithiol biosynthesis cysteine-adding enzyme BshC
MKGSLKVCSVSTIECYPITVTPGASRLFVDFCSAADEVRPFYGAALAGSSWEQAPVRPPHWAEIVDLLSIQNPGATASIAALRAGAGTVLTGQQVGLFGGPLFTGFKAATALARVRQATVSSRPHAAIFWLASEDHDFAEIDHVTFPSRHELKRFTYPGKHSAAVPVGSIVLDETIAPLLDEAAELIGWSDALEALQAAYRPGRTFAQAFADFYARAFAAQGLLVFDAALPEAHKLGAPVLLAAIERADELHAALLDRNRALTEAGYHAQVAVGSGSSLLFLMDSVSGARLSLKRTPPSVTEPNGLWQAGRTRYSTAELAGILASEPHRISPSALLRPVFQDFLFGTSLIIGGPAEIAYFAQSAVLFERILDRTTPAQQRFSATLVEPAIADLLRRHDLGPDRVFSQTKDGLAQLLAARAMPIEGKRKLAAAGNALDAELIEVEEWMNRLDEGLGRSASTAGSKMRYQMNRLRRLAANFQLEKEAALGRHAQALVQALFPNGAPQERVHCAAYYFARHGFELAEEMVTQAASDCAGHSVIWL